MQFMIAPTLPKLLGFLVQLLVTAMPSSAATVYNENILTSNSDTLNKPNIIFIFADDLGYRDIGYQDSDIYTPFLDHLAHTGVRLDNYYVQPTCAPTRSSFMAGRYEIHMGIQHDEFGACDWGGLPLKYPTLADVMRKAGYSTHAIGKWHLGFFRKEYTPLYRGFDTFYGNLPGYSYHFSYKCCADIDAVKVCGYGLMDGELPHFQAYGRYSTTVYTDRAIEIVKAASSSDKPFFMYLNYQAPHAPIEAPLSYWDSYINIENEERRQYAGMVTTIDEGVAKVVQALKEEGLWNNTILIFSSDNGGEVYEGGNNWPLRGNKNTNWEGAVRTVGFVNSPLLDKELEGTTNQGLMHVTDWFPTLAEIAGATLNDSLGLDGISQWSMIRDGAASQRTEILHGIDHLWPRWGTSLYNTSFDTRIKAALRVGDYKILTGDPGDGNWYQIPTSIGYRESPEYTGPKESHVWLFNIAKDPHELRDLSESMPEKVLEMLDRLAEYDTTSLEPKESYTDPNCDPQLHGGFWGPWVK